MWLQTLSTLEKMEQKLVSTLETFARLLKSLRTEEMAAGAMEKVVGDANVTTVEKSDDTAMTFSLAIDDADDEEEEEEGEAEDEEGSQDQWTTTTLTSDAKERHKPSQTPRELLEALLSTLHDVENIIGSLEVPRLGIQTDHQLFYLQDEVEALQRLRGAMPSSSLTSP